jgi:hypothetical protein
VKNAGEVLGVRTPRALEHLPKKLHDFFDQNMLRLCDSERVLFDQMTPSDRETL